MEKKTITLVVIALLIGMSLFATMPALATSKQTSLKVAIIYVSPAAFPGWSFAHDAGINATITELKAQGITVELTRRGFDNGIPEPDSERHIREFANAGYDVVITTSFGYEPYTRDVAKEFPKTLFLHCSGVNNWPGREDPQASGLTNFVNYFGKNEDARYLAGLVAGKLSKTNTVGYVNAVPIVETARLVNAFTMGVREANPQATVLTAYTGAWFAPADEAVVAESFIRRGADVMAQDADSDTMPSIAEKAGVFAIGSHADMSGAAPTKYVGTPLWHWNVYYTYAIGNLASGAWRNPDGTVNVPKGERYANWGLKPRGGATQSITDFDLKIENLPADKKDEIVNLINTARQKLIAEDMPMKTESYWTANGPLKANNGTVMFQQGVAVPMEHLYFDMNYHVFGINQLNLEELKPVTTTTSVVSPTTSTQPATTTAALPATTVTPPPPSTDYSAPIAIIIVLIIAVVAIAVLRARRKPN